MLYGLPGVFFPAAIGLLAGPGILVTLIVALLVAWSAGQGLAYFGYTRLGRTMDMNEARRVMRFALLGGLAVVTVAMAVTGHLVHATGSVMLFGAGEGVYMLGAGVLMVIGTERWLLAALAPGVLGSAAFLALGSRRAWPTRPGRCSPPPRCWPWRWRSCSPGRRVGHHPVARFH